MPARVWVRPAGRGRGFVTAIDTPLDIDWFTVRGGDFVAGGRYRVEVRSDDIDVSKFRIRTFHVRNPWKHTHDVFFSDRTDGYGSGMSTWDFYVAIEELYSKQPPKFIGAAINPDFTTWLSKLENGTSDTGNKGLKHARVKLAPYETDPVAGTAYFRTRPVGNGGFHIEVNVTDDSVGAYWIRVISDPVRTWNGSEIGSDDLPDGSTTWADLSVGIGAEGRYGFGGDEDWYELDLTAGTTGRSDDEPVACPVGQFVPARQLQLPQYRRDVGLHRLDADVQALGYLLVWIAAGGTATVQWPPDWNKPNNVERRWFVVTNDVFPTHNLGTSDIKIRPIPSSNTCSHLNPQRSN